MADDNRDHFRWGSVAVGAATPAVTGAYFGVLVLQADTTFTTLTNDAENPTVLAGLTYAAGTYLPIGVSAIDVNAGAVLIGRTQKRTLT